MVLAGEELAQCHLIVAVGKARDIDGLAVIVQSARKTVTDDPLKITIEAERNGRILPQRVEHDDAFLRAALSERRINKDERRTKKREPDQENLHTVPVTSCLSEGAIIAPRCDAATRE